MALWPAFGLSFVVMNPLIELDAMDAARAAAILIPIGV